MSKKEYQLIQSQYERQTSQGYTHRQVWTAPDAADPDALLNDQATSDSVVTTVTSGFLAQPDFPVMLLLPQVEPLPTLPQVIT